MNVASDCTVLRKEGLQGVGRSARDKVVEIDDVAWGSGDDTLNQDSICRPERTSEIMCSYFCTKSLPSKCSFVTKLPREERDRYMTTVSGSRASGPAIKEIGAETPTIARYMMASGMDVKPGWLGCKS
jgi:hypothetical protein